MNYFSKFWLSSSFLFDPVQRFFNGNFWGVFEKKFGNFRNERILDIACGTGELLNHIHPKNYLGVDINASYIKYCQTRFDKKGIEFQKVDATKIKFNRNFDTIFFVGSMHHFSDKQLDKLNNSLSRSKTKKIIICDGIPFGIFKPILAWLDSSLGGGKYFRNQKVVKNILEKYFIVKKAGRLKSDASFYYYCYWVLKPRRR